LKYLSFEKKGENVRRCNVIGNVRYAISLFYFVARCFEKGGDIIIVEKKETTPDRAGYLMLSSIIFLMVS